MKAEHGSRFSHLSNNAAKALKFFNELEDFCKLNPGSLKLRELLNLIRKHENLIKSELKSISACWLLVLNPLWITLRKSNAKDSVALIDKFTDFAKAIQKSSEIKPAVKVYNPVFNTFMHEFDQSCIETHILNAITTDQNDEVLNETIQKMLKLAADYMLKLSNSWVRDTVPDAPVPFSNQVNILLMITNHVT